MQLCTEDRRTRRSSDPLIALHYQLNQTRKTQGLDALVMADAAGVVVAAAGCWAVCEELAAYAPLLAAEEPVLDTSTRLESLRNQVRVRPLDVAGLEFLLCARGQGELDGAIAEAAEGVSRILQRAA